MFSQRVPLLCVVVVIFGLLLLSGCQTMDTPVLRATAAAQSSQDVAAAWDLYCGDYNFGPVPPNCDVTVGSLYQGSSFASDISHLLHSMQLELHSSKSPNCDDDELLTAVLEDPIWFE